MRYKRKEAFRYQFRTPIEGQLRILNVNGKERRSNITKVLVHDISPHGLRISTPLDLAASDFKMKVELIFTLIDQHITVGEIIWQNRFADVYFYGIKLLLNDEEERNIIYDVKKYKALE